MPEITRLEDGGLLLYWPAWLEREAADRAFGTLRDEIAWEQRSIRLMGKEIPQPRLVAWHGDAAYTYSGLTLEPHPWTPLLASLRDRAAADAGALFNSVIASVSLGAARRFVLRHAKKKRIGIDLALSHGSLLVMAGRTQHVYRHGLPKTTAPVGQRINLTFRRIGPRPE